MTENRKNNILQDFVGKKLFENIIVYSANFDTPMYVKRIGPNGLHKECINWLTLTFLNCDNSQMSTEDICLCESDTIITLAYFDNDKIICHSLDDFNLHEETLLNNVIIYDVKTREFTNINVDKLCLN